MIAERIGFIAFALTLMSTTGTLRAAERGPQPAAAVAASRSFAVAPVEIDGNVLFSVRGTVSYPAELRARSIKERIEAAAADPAVPIESLRLIPGEALVKIAAGDQTLMTVYDADARLEEVSVAAIAEAHRRRIAQAIADYRRARSPEAVQRSALSAGVATLAFVIGVLALFTGARWLEGWISKRAASHIGSVGIDSLELVQAERVQRGIVGTVRFTRALLLLIGLIAYLAFALGQFPWTHALSRRVVGLVADPLATMTQAILAEIPNLVFLAMLLWVLRIFLRLLRLFFDSLGDGRVKLSGFEPEWAVPTYKIVRFAVVAFGVIVAYPYIPGSHSEAFKGVSLFVGVLFSLGSTSTLSNLIAGYMMTYRRAFKVGDRVRIGDTVGDVVQTRLQVTHLRTPKNEEVVLPNSQILNNPVLNYSSLAQTQGLILHVNVGIGYETPWRQVEAMLCIAAERTPGLLREPKPFILYKGLGDFAVTYELNVHCDDPQAMERLYAALSRNILDVFNEYGVQIMTPAYENDPAQAKLVPREDWFVAPAKPPPEDVGSGPAPPTKIIKRQ
jgi:small-conductance mechanosensitive channel